MKATKKQVAVTLGAAVLSLGVLGGVTAIHAAGTANPETSLVAKIASKFNLKTEDVQAVFDEQHTVDDAQRIADEKTRLDALVKAGTLTQAQEDLIIAKQAEEKTFMESLKDKTDADRKAALDAHRTELEKWATENNIDMKYLHGFGGHGGHGGPGRGPRGSDATTTGATLN